MSTCFMCNNPVSIDHQSLINGHFMHTDCFNFFNSIRENYAISFNNSPLTVSVFIDCLNGIKSRLSPETINHYLKETSQKYPDKLTKSFKETALNNRVEMPIVNCYGVAVYLSSSDEEDTIEIDDESSSAIR